MSHNPFEKYDEIKAPPFLSKKVLASSSKKMNPKLSSMSFKYSLIFMTSVLFSLMICPQKGVGLVRSDFPFFHHLLHKSELLCGLYCGLVFFLTTHLLTFFLMNHFERLKIIKSFSYLPVMFISGFYGLSMTSMFSNTQFGLSYNLSWLAVVGLCYLILNRSYLQKVRHP